jgi:hypothetical protein
MIRGQRASLSALFFMEVDMKRYIGMLSLLSVLWIKPTVMGFG